MCFLLTIGIKKSTDMQNIGRYGGYLFDTVDTCTMCATNKEQNKDVFKKQHDRWEKFLVEDMYMAMCNARQNGKIIGLSDVTIMKMTKEAQKKFQNDAAQEKAPTGR